MGRWVNIELRSLPVRGGMGRGVNIELLSLSPV